MAAKGYDQIANRNRDLIRRNMKVAKNFFDKYQDQFHWIPQKGGSISVFKSIRHPAESFCHQLAREHGIVLLPSKFMRSSDEWIRIGLGRENFKVCLEKLDDVLGGKET